MRFHYLSLLIAIYFLIITKKAYCQLDFNFSGYIYNIPSFQIIHEFQKLLDNSLAEDKLFSDLTRIRLRPELLVFEGNGRFTLHYEMDLLLSSLQILEITEPGFTNRQSVSLYQRFINNDKVKVAHFIDLLYYKHSFDLIEFTAGRQLISWGVGRVWQPTDLFNPINPANYSKFEKDGADAISSKIFLGSFTDIELVYNLRGKYSSGNFAGRFRTNISEYDFSIMTGYFDKDIVIGGDFAGNLFDAGFRGEAVFKKKKELSESGCIRFILGIDYQITSQLYGALEYQYNSEGTVNKSEYFSYFEKIIKGELQNIGKNYFAIIATYQIHPLISSNIISITNLDDRSGFINVSAKYSAFENINFNLGGIFFYGSDMSEYSYYSTSIYGLFELYF